MDNHQKVVGMFMDLSEAFDSICPNLMSEKLYNPGICSNIHNWLRSYLSDRKQFVQIANYSNNFISQYNSKLANIKYGCLQRSNSGTSSFLCYLTELPQLQISKPMSICRRC